jgi:ABC-type transport system involved in multi-copper enzyme maturation permease subunit
MIGPVLHQELLLGSRRNKLHILRWIYAGWLVIYLLSVYLYFLVADQARVFQLSMNGHANVTRASAPVVVGTWFADSFVTQQVILLLLITPPFVAGAITDEKRRGTLQHLLLTDLESRHIILGKLVGRVALLGLVMLAGLPLFALCAGFGGIDIFSILVTLAALVMPLVGLASATILASVWCRQTRDAVLALYAVGVVVGLIIVYVEGPLAYLDPLFVHAPAWEPTGNRDLAEAGRRLLYSALSWGAISAVFLAVAMARLRAAYVREIESLRATRAWYGVDRVPVSDEPIRWRERHVEGLAPNAMLRAIPTWLGIALVSTLTTVSSLAILYFHLPKSITLSDVLRALLTLNLARLQLMLPDTGGWFLLQSIVAMLLAGLLVGIRLSGAITSEREKQTWEAVLLTPLTAKSIVRGKLWGVLGASLWYLLAYAAPAVILSALGGPLALFFTLIMLAVTCLVMYFIGATGLYSSATCSSSWRALFNTMAVAYVGGLILYLVTSPVMALLALIIWICLYVLDRLMSTSITQVFGFNGFGWVFVITSWVGLAALFLWLSHIFLDRTLRWIADRERTRHWHDEPVYRRSRRGRDVPKLTHDF